MNKAKSELERPIYSAIEVQRLLNEIRNLQIDNMRLRKLLSIAETNPTPKQD